MISSLLVSLLLVGSEAIAKESIATDPYWRRLLHYKKDVLGHERSLVDSPRFFFSSQGKFDAQAELDATVAAFEQKENLTGVSANEHPQCRFPERFRFLQSKGIVFQHHVDCSDFKEWKGSLDADSATLIFASAYAHTPASLFGHTFLRLNSRSQKGLRDYGANFSAITSNDNLIAYAFKGVFGGYPGVFSVSPYYEKLNEYIFVENRDIWEYELELDHEAIERLIHHLWELYANATFDYYYFDENCSYQLLGLLEVARPDWSLTNFTLYVTPLETLRRVRDVGGLAKRTYRPSSQKSLETRVAKLTFKEKKTFDRLIRRDLPPDSQVGSKVLDAASSYFFHKKLSNKGRLNSEDSETMHQVLTARSRIDENTKPLPIEVGQSPEFGHPPYRLGVGWVRLGGKDFAELGARLGVHDLLNMAAGYSPFAEFKILDLRLRIDTSNLDVQLAGIEFFRVSSLTPLTSLEKVPSYQLEVNYKNVDDRACANQNCLAPGLLGGVGPAMTVLDSSVLIWTMVIAEWRGDSRATPSEGIAGGEAAVLAHGPEKQKVLYKWQARKHFREGQTSDWTYLNLATYAFAFNENHELRARLRWGSRAEDEAGLEWGYFF